MEKKAPAVAVSKTIPISKGECPFDGKPLPAWEKITDPNTMRSSILKCPDCDTIYLKNTETGRVQYQKAADGEWKCADCDTSMAAYEKKLPTYEYPEINVRSDKMKVVKFSYCPNCDDNEVDASEGMSYTFRFGRRFFMRPRAEEEVALGMRDKFDHKP